MSPDALRADIAGTFVALHLQGSAFPLDERCSSAGPDRAVDGDAALRG
jgi:hypothetical protein